MAIALELGAPRFHAGISQINGVPVCKHILAALLAQQ